MSRQAERRRAGVLIPLFACPSTASWGIGEIGDLAAVGAWLGAAGQGVLQLLPINEMAPGQQSPYSAISAMAIDPIFITVAAVPDFERAGGERALAPADRALIAVLRQAPGIRYAEVRRLKHGALTAAFECFLETEWRRGGPRADDFRAFVHEQAWWLDEYAAFRAIHAREGERPWTEWPEPLKRRDPGALERARRELSREIMFRQYLQWVADRQWRAARAGLRGTAVYGDLPFMVDGDSADVWARQQQFRLDASIGVPPDAFSASGQDWGMPVYRWEALAADDFRWLRERARRSADLYDGYRIDHVVGFYRTYGRPRGGGAPFFTPADPPDQLALGERILEVFRAAGSEIIAEDLGTVPEFVRESLARLGVPGFRVLRWERFWDLDGQPFRDPADYPPCSVAASGTHDTETQLAWWDRASDDERRQVSELPTIQRVSGKAGLLGADEIAVRDVLLEALFASGSNLVLLPIQDVFGWRDRINDPATPADANWVFRLRWPSDRAGDEAEARSAQARLRRWAEQYGRY